jgi:hypothetical protein
LSGFYWYGRFPHILNIVHVFLCLS